MCRHLLTKEEGGKQLPQVIHKTGRCLERDLVPLPQSELCLHPVDPVQKTCMATHCSIKPTVNITVAASSIITACIVKHASMAKSCVTGMQMSKQKHFSNVHGRSAF